MSDINMQTTQNYKKNCMAGYNAISSNVYANNHNDNKELPEEDNNLSPGAATVTADVISTNVVDDETPKAFNLYRNKKLISHGMMDIALFSANANQLRYVLEASDGNAISVICVSLLLTSIFLQILVGVALLLSARYNVTNCDQREMAFKFGNYVIVGIFLITIVNVFITSFGGPPGTPTPILVTSVTNRPDIS